MATEWKNLVENYENFQNELDNTANGIDFLKALLVEFHKFEVIYHITYTILPHSLPNSTINLGFPYWCLLGTS